MSAAGSKRAAMFSGSPKGKMAMSAVNASKYAAQLRIGHLTRKAGGRSFLPQLYLAGRTAYDDKDAFKAAMGGVLRNAGLLLESFVDTRNGSQVHMYDFGYSTQYEKTLCTVLSILMAERFATVIKAATPARSPPSLFPSRALPHHKLPVCRRTHAGTPSSALI